MGEEGVGRGEEGVGKGWRGEGVEARLRAQGGACGESGWRGWATTAPFGFAYYNDCKYIIRMYLLYKSSVCECECVCVCVSASFGVSSVAVRKYCP